MDRRYWIVIGIMIILTPLGLLADGTAWGEWSGEDLTTTLGFVPQGIEQAGDWWKAAFPDYSMKFLGEGDMADRAGYIMSAVLGSGFIYGVTLILGKMLAKTNYQIAKNKQTAK